MKLKISKRRIKNLERKLQESDCQSKLGNAEKRQLRIWIREYMQLFHGE